MNSTSISNNAAILGAGQHLTLSGSLNNSWQTNSSDGLIQWGTEPHVKRYQLFEIEEDLLALSCTWQRIRKANLDDPTKPRALIETLTDSELFSNIKHEDRTKAESIRDYYSKKIMLWKLKNQKLTTFREDMNSFIHTDGKMFKEIMMPLAYRLPEFYDYDTAFEILLKDYNKQVSQTIQNFVGVKELKLVKTFVVGKRSSKRKEYWFSDNFNDLICLSIQINNPLMSLLDTYTKNTVKINANYTKNCRDNIEYLIPNKFKFL